MQIFYLGTPSGGQLNQDDVAERLKDEKQELEDMTLQV